MKMFITFLLCSKLLQSDEWFYFVTDHHGFSFGHVFRNIFSVCLNPYMDAVFILIFEAEEFDVVLHVVSSRGSDVAQSNLTLYNNVAQLLAWNHTLNHCLDIFSCITRYISI